MTISTTSPSEIQEVPSVQIVDEQVRGRKHVITPLGEDAVTEFKHEHYSATTNTSSEASQTKPSTSRRSSLAAFADRLRSRSRSHSRQGPSDDHHDLERTTTQSSTVSTGSRSNSKSRRSIEKERENAPFGEVVKAQREFMENLRAEQFRNGITHNVDGLPLPPYVPGEERDGTRSRSRSRAGSRSGSPVRSRRSSVTHILGLDKELLAL